MGRYGGPDRAVKYRACRQLDYEAIADIHVGSGLRSMVGLRRTVVTNIRRTKRFTAIGYVVRRALS